MSVLFISLVSIFFMLGESYVESTPTKVDNIAFSGVKMAICAEAKEQNKTIPECEPVKTAVPLLDIIPKALDIPTANVINLLDTAKLLGIGELDG